MNLEDIKYSGYTHASFRVGSIEDTGGALDAAAIPIREDPVDLGGTVAVFVRDLDGDVIELGR